ncbi:hypothetical protein EAS68_09885 [Legionella jordanis]|nr:hypothetical protein EAS68_09885 [Legionella jordanis]
MQKNSNCYYIGLIFRLEDEMPKVLYSPAPSAFLAYEAIQIEQHDWSKVLFSLYKAEPCYTYENPQYGEQLAALIDVLANFVLKNVANPEVGRIREEVEILKKELKDTSYVSENAQVQKAYYLSYKKNLETIFFLIRDWEELKKRQFIMALGERVMVCATGAHTQLAEIVFELTQKPTLISWLAELRKNIVHEFAEEWIAKHKIRDGSSIHVHYFCNRYGETLGWNIPGSNEISGYSDERFKPQGLNHQTQNQLKDYFEKNYNYQTILNNIVVNFNSLLSPYYPIPLTPDLDKSICSILEPFTEHGILSMSDVYSYDEEDGESVWRIRPDFKTNLPKYVKTLLIKEKIITSNVPMIVNQEMIPLLEEEIERLEIKYQGKDNRIQVLENTLSFLINTITKEETTEYESVIAKHIQELYIHSGLDKYNSLQRIGLVLLNALMILPLGICGAFKYAATGSFFFSHHGKTQDLINSIYREVSLHVK